MKIQLRVLAFYVPVVVLQSACDTFAPPPKRDAVSPMLSPAPTVSTVITAATVATSSLTSTPPPPTSSTAPDTACLEIRTDMDGDGFTTVDCPAGTPLPRPNPEIDDCDDFDAARHLVQTLYIDGDGDGFGSHASTHVGCEGDVVERYVSNSLDCDDTDPNKHQRVAYDGDGDTFGAGTSMCGVAADGWVPSAGDCADDDPAVHPGGTEVAFDGVDSDCDNYDVPSFRIDEPMAVIEWTDGALCKRGVLAVVAIDRGTQPPGGVYLQVGNVGAYEVANATLVLQQLQPQTETTWITLPVLAPGEVVRTQNIYVGSYQATFEDTDAQATDTQATDTQAALDASVDAGSSGDAQATDADTPNARCERAQQPFAFTSTKVEPL